MDNTNFSYVTELQPGTTLNNGKYTIERKIGQGGFGITYRAVQNGLGRQVCIKEYFIEGKCIRNTMATTVHLQNLNTELFEKYRHAFIREAQTLAQLHHPGIVEVIDVFDENNTSYMVMPFIEGQSLQSIVEKNGPLNYSDAANYIVQLARAVDYIHQHHILHRDIKPDNIMITADYKAVLIDFGSAREFEQDKTQAHTSMVTHGYAPIEQYNTTSRKGSYTDIYAIGATLYFVLTGQQPIDSTARLMEEMPEPKQLNPSIPDVANRTIMKAMQVKAYDRHQTAQEFMDDLCGKMYLQPIYETKEPDGEFLSRTSGLVSEQLYSQPTPTDKKTDDNILIWSILATIFCCPPFGIPAIVYSSKVERLRTMGDYNGAEEAVSKARVWAWVSFGVGLFLTLVYALVLVISSMN